MESDLNTTTLENTAGAFLGYLTRLGKSPSTIKRWAPELDLLLEWAAGRSLVEISARDLGLDYLNWWFERFQLRNGRPPAANTTRAATQAVKSFFAFCERFELLVDESGRSLSNPAKALELPTISTKAELDWLRGEEDARLMAVRMNERERIQVFLLRHTGLRLTEALTLLVRDLDLTSRTLHVRSSKTPSGFRSIPISRELAVHAEQWLAYLRLHGLYRVDGPFLVTRNGTAMCSQQVPSTIARVGKRAGLARRLTPHVLRRTFGSHLLNHDVRLEAVSRLLGHSSTGVTERCYARLQDDVIREEMSKALPA